MADYIIEDSTVTAIADAIRTKDGTTAAIKGSDIAARISAIVSGAEFYGGAIETGTVVQNGTTMIIPHSLGTVRGFIMYAPDSDVFRVCITDEIDEIIVFTNGDGFNMSYDQSITNGTGEVTFELGMSLQNIQYSYILLGA